MLPFGHTIPTDNRQLTTHRGVGHSGPEADNRQLFSSLPLPHELVQHFTLEQSPRLVPVLHTEDAGLPNFDRSIMDGWYGTAISNHGEFQLLMFGQTC